jgi:hypothetical protein
MNGPQLHLALNHLPVVGVPACFLLLAAAFARKSRDLAGAGFAGLVLVALIMIAAFKTGGPAARVVRNLPGIAPGSIHEHAEAADWGLWTMQVLGAVGIAGLWFESRAGKEPGRLAAAALMGALFVSTVMVRIAHLGGLIRHPEISSDFKPIETAKAP